MTTYAEQTVGTVAGDLRAKAGAAGDARRALGYGAPRDGGGGLFVWEADTTTPDDGGLVIVPDDGAARAGCWRRVLDRIGEVDVRWFGAKGDGQTDDLPAFQAAVRSLPNALPPWGLPDASPLAGGVVRVPPGYYVLKAPWVLDRDVRVEGAGAIASGVPKSRLACLHAGDGVRLAAGAAVRGLWLGTPAGNAGCGVLATTRCALEAVVVSGFGTGFRFAGSAADGTNADSSRAVGCRAQLCAGDGFHLLGGDANACVLLGCDAVDNGGAGYRDNSFLGNLHAGNHASSNAGGDYVCEPPLDPSAANCRADFVACYSEGGVVRIDLPATCYGGFAASANTGSGFTLNGAQGGIVRHLTAVNSLDPARQTSVTLGSVNTPGAVLEFSAQDAQDGTYSELPYRLVYVRTGPGGVLWPQYELQYGGVAGAPVAFTGRDHPRGYSQLAFQTGLWLGPKTFERWLGTTAGAPPAGAKSAGSVAHEVAPQPGGAAAYCQCPDGVWRPYARVDP